MRVAIMQPYFFPYIGYFDLLHNVDLFVVYDTVQYIRRGWINRNRICQQGGDGWQYIIVPIQKAPQRTPVREINISSDAPWKERILGQLAHYERRAPFADETSAFVRDCFASEEASISRLDVTILARCAQLMNMSFEYRFCSELDTELDSTRSAEDRILDLCEFLGAREYVNLPGGVDLYEPDHFASRNIKLTFRHLPTFVYRTKPYEFVPNLSIIDLLMWKKPEDLHAYLDAHEGTGKSA
jgi:hypothetical protein